MVNRKFLCSPWNSSSACEDWSVCAVSWHRIAGPIFLRHHYLGALYLHNPWIPWAPYWRGNFWSMIPRGQHKLHSNLEQAIPAVCKLNHFKRTMDPKLIGFGTARFSFSGATVKTVPTVIIHPIWITKNQHIQHHCWNFIHDIAVSVWTFFVMLGYYAICWCTLSKLYNMMCYKHVTLNKVLVLEYHHVAHMNLAKMALALENITLLSFLTLRSHLKYVTMYFYWDTISEKLCL